MVRDLEVLKLLGIIIFYSELQVEHRAVPVGIFEPASLDQGLPQCTIATNNDENFDIRLKRVLFPKNAEIGDHRLLYLSGVPGQEFLRGAFNLFFGFTLLFLLLLLDLLLLLLLLRFPDFKLFLIPLGHLGPRLGGFLRLFFLSSLSLLSGSPLLLKQLL